MEAVGRHIVVKHKATENTTSGGIILDAKPKSHPIAEVLSVGADVIIDVHPGEFIIFDSFVYEKKEAGYSIMIIHDSKVFAKQSTLN